MMTLDIADEQISWVSVTTTLPDCVKYGDWICSLLSIVWGMLLPAPGRPCFWLCVFVYRQDNCKSCRRILVKFWWSFWRGWMAWLTTTDSILMVIRMRMRLRELLKGILNVVGCGKFYDFFG